jgi:hypothetical protein
MLTSAVLNKFVNSLPRSLITKFKNHQVRVVKFNGWEISHFVIKNYNLFLSGQYYIGFLKLLQM